MLDRGNKANNYTIAECDLLAYGRRLLYWLVKYVFQFLLLNISSFFNS